MESVSEWVSRHKRSSGTDCGYGDGSGVGSGCVYGSGIGDDAGSGFGDGSGYGSGVGDGSGFDGYGGVGGGKGSGIGSPTGSGVGCIYGTNSKITRINGQQVYNIDGVNTVISKVRGNVAHGDIVLNDLSFVPCYVVRGEGYYAHGKTLTEAREALMKKILGGENKEERIARFIRRFPKDKVQKGTEYYEWHHILTGSCKMGRDNFVKSRDLDLSKEYTPAEFIRLTKESYGGDIIKDLEKAYAQQERS